jgi:nucleotide-binding universal stress UspA family protein
VDFSDFSRHAFDRAVAIARSYGSDITLLHVLPVPSAVPAVPYGPEGPGAFGFETMDRERALTELSRTFALERSPGATLHYEALQSPSVHREILVQAAKISADLVVMGSHGRSGFDHLFLGSVAEKTLRSSPVPVLVVPPRVRDADGGNRDPFRRVLCAVDFSQDSAKALGYAASLATHAGGDLTLVHVVESMPVAYDPMVGVSFDVAAYEAGMREAAKTQLQKMVGEFTLTGPRTQVVVAQGRPYKEILRVAAERASDVVVIGVHGRNALDRLVFGSTADNLVRRASCPVLAVREQPHR